MVSADGVIIQSIRCLNLVNLGAALTGKFCITFAFQFVLTPFGDFLKTLSHADLIQVFSSGPFSVYEMLSFTAKVMA